MDWHSCYYSIRDSKALRAEEPPGKHRQQIRGRKKKLKQGHY